MNTSSRGNWSRSSAELCRKATYAALRRRDLDNHDYDFDEQASYDEEVYTYTDPEAQLKDETTPLVPTSISVDLSKVDIDMDGNDGAAASTVGSLSSKVSYGSTIVDYADYNKFDRIDTEKMTALPAAFPDNDSITNGSIATNGSIRSLQQQFDISPSITPIRGSSPSPPKRPQELSGHRRTKTPTITNKTSTVTTSAATVPVENKTKVASVGEGGGGRVATVTTTHHSRVEISNKDILIDELKCMIQLGLPVIGTYLLEMLPGIISLVLVGHVTTKTSTDDHPYISSSEESTMMNTNATFRSKQLLDAASLAVTFFSLTSLSIGFGLSSAMDTLCSQAYGANEMEIMGLYFQTGILVLSITFVVMVVINYHSTDIFIAIGQPIEISELAGIFVCYLSPGIPFLYIYELIRKILQSSNVALPLLYVAVMANLINIGFGYYLTYHTSIGWLGAAIARTVCHVSFLLLMVVYLWYSEVGKLYWKPIWGDRGIVRSFTSWSTWCEAYEGIPEFVDLGIPGALQLCFEWWAFDLIPMICGLLPNSILAIGANSIILNIATLMYMFYLGVSIAANVRIGNALGAGKFKRAKLASQLALGISVFLASMCATFVLIFREQLPALFTHDEEMVEFAAELLYIVAFFQLPDAINASIQGIFRGSGRQGLGAYLNFVAYYVAGIPIGILLAFQYHYNVMGLWFGVTFGLLGVAIVGTILVHRSNWEQLATDAMSRLNED